MKRLNHGGNLVRPRELIIVYELRSGGVVEREVEGETRLVKKGLGWMGSLGEPIELSKLQGVDKCRPTDGQIQDGVPLGLAMKRQQQCKTNGENPQKVADKLECTTLLADDPDANKNRGRGDGAEAKKSRTAGDRQEEGETKQMEKNQVLSNCGA